MAVAAADYNFAADIIVRNLRAGRADGPRSLEPSGLLVQAGESARVFLPSRSPSVTLRWPARGGAGGALVQVARDLALLHLSDTDNKAWGHNQIGTGAIDFAAVTEQVKRIGYAGPTIMEIVDRQTPDESNPISLERLRALGWTT